MSTPDVRDERESLRRIAHAAENNSEQNKRLADLIERWQSPEWMLEMFGAILPVVVGAEAKMREAAAPVPAPKARKRSAKAN